MHKTQKENGDCFLVSINLKAMKRSYVCAGHSNARGFRSKHGSKLFLRRFCFLVCSLMR